MDPLFLLLQAAEGQAPVTPVIPTAPAVPVTSVTPVAQDAPVAPSLPVEPVALETAPSVITPPGPDYQELKKSEYPPLACEFSLLQTNYILDEVLPVGTKITFAIQRDPQDENHILAVIYDPKNADKSCIFDISGTAYNEYNIDESSVIISPRQYCEPYSGIFNQRSGKINIERMKNQKNVLAQLYDIDTFTNPSQNESQFQFNEGIICKVINSIFTESRTRTIIRNDCACFGKIPEMMQI